MGWGFQNAFSSWDLLLRNRRGDHLRELLRREPPPVEHHCSDPIGSALSFPLIRSEAIREDHDVRPLRGTQRDLPRWAELDEAPPVDQRALQGFVEVHAIATEILGVLSFRERPEENPTHFAPELARAEHELALELTCHTRIQGT